ncbi:MAG: hypothetical protein WC557_00285 [Ignavibacteriaceae bacterium]
MEIEEKKIIEMLDIAVRDKSIKQQMDTIVKRVVQTLENDPKAPMMAWEPIPLNIYNQQLISDIKSSWVFILRKNTTTGAERHPNSIQRMMSYKGYGDFQTKPDLKWDSNFLESDFEGEIEKRWISIQLNVWHQGIVGDENWIVISFHTAEVSELIEERPEEGDENKIHKQKYVDKALKK